MSQLNDDTNQNEEPFGRFFGCLPIDLIVEIILIIGPECRLLNRSFKHLFDSNNKHLIVQDHLYKHPQDIIKLITGVMMTSMQLTSITCQCVDFNDENILYFAVALTDLKYLRELVIAGYMEKLDERGATSLSNSLSHLTGLRKLDLSSNDIGSEHFTFFAKALDKLTGLQELDLSNNWLCALDIAPALMNLTCLQELDLSNNDIGESFSVLATALSNLTGLRRLQLKPRIELDSINACYVVT